MQIFLTGSAGFIGYHVSLKILKQKKFKLISVDNLNDYYDVKLKKDRLKELNKYKNFTFIKMDFSNFDKLKKIFLKTKIDVIIHLAAQAGVRHSIVNPKSYFKSNMMGFFNILECSRIFKIKHLLFASSSSVYGSNTNFPLKELYNTDHPLSFYAATKKSNEVMAYSYSNIYKLPCTAMRFFTVYGPFGRPDMALFKFTKAILKNKPIDVHNNGNHIRDFTYIDDIVVSIIKLIEKKPKKPTFFKVLNIGSDNPKDLKYFIKNIEKILNKKAIIKLMKIQPGDVIKTHADIKELKKITKYKPMVKIEEGIKKFVDWYISYYE